MFGKHLGLVLVLLATACAHAPPPATLVGVDGSRRSLTDFTHRAPWTVVMFVSSTCPCMASHRDPLEDLAAAYAPRGVRFLAVESDVTTTPESLAAEAREYSMPLLRDDGARLANALGAESATYTVIVDREGRVRYRGGFDSDRVTRHPDATPYVREALDDLLAGKPPRRPETNALGCMLRKY